MVSQLLIIFELAPTSIYPWLAFGLLANSAMVVYAHLTRFFQMISGRVITAVNVMTLGVFLIQYLIEENFSQRGKMANTVPKVFLGFWISFTSSVPIIHLVYTAQICESRVSFKTSRLLERV